MPPRHRGGKGKGRRHSLWIHRSGAVLVEFTLVAPLLIFLTLGTFEFGRALQQHHVLDKGVRDAARYLARVPLTCSGGTYTWGDATDLTNAKNLVVTGSTTGGSPIISNLSDSDIQISVNCIDNSAGTYRGYPEIPVVTVTARVTYQDFGFLAALGLSAPTFSASHEELSIGE